MDLLLSGLWSLDRRTPVYLAGTARLETFQSDKSKVTPLRFLFVGLITVTPEAVTAIAGFCRFLSDLSPVFVTNLGGHPKPAIGGHLKSGQRDS